MKTKDFWYCLKEELIAQKPRVPRDSSRLLVIDETNRIEHSKFIKLKNYLCKGDLLVINDTKTIRARIYGKRRSGGNCEILLLRKVTSENNERWEVLCKPARKLKAGEEVFVGKYVLLIVKEFEEGLREVEFINCGSEEVIKKYGRVPLPPYIKREDLKEDRKSYQTVYAKEGNSVAAPTAGLHFTDRVIASLIRKGVEIVRIRLDVGLGTFKPVLSENINDHKMHKEYYFIPREAANKINVGLKEKRRIFAVGTTVVRTLEDQMERFGKITEGGFDTDLFIKPGFKFRAVDAMVTNFHLPETTLLMLVSAFKTREVILKAYSEAIKEKYRFYSYGDAMLLLNRK